MNNSYLVAVDNSDGSKRALQHAVERAKASSAKLILTHVIDWSPYSFHTPDELAERTKRREEEIIRARDIVLVPLAEEVRQAGLEVEIEIQHGRGAETLAQLAEQHNVAQIIAGRSGETNLKTLMFGSTSSKLVQISSVPVLIVP
ncbi:universal stress protein [Kiloniella sp. b19]|uniref:universal stress protein n=1 Tax=Kiloniella sp. GXU_MW_B19 TaxID=3141326 RepID=UPI0031DDCEA6